MSQEPQSCRTTVGILTVGDPAFVLCRSAIEEQINKHFLLEVISKISPFNAAFQELVKRTSTEYVIQVDEDMILFPYAVGRMQEVMDAAPPEIGMILFYLLDPDRNQRIHGIKIFRTEALRKLWARDVKASEMDLLEQMLEVGYHWVIHPETMGRHGVIYSPETIYGRYKSMYEKDISTWNAVTTDIRRKANAFAQSGDPVELFALLGAAHGLMNVPFLEDKEKDYTQYNSKTLSVLKQALLSYPAQSFPFDTSKGETKFKNTPIPFEQVSWKSDSAAISAQAISINRQDTAPAPELVAIDQRIIENIPLEAFGSQLAQQPHDGFLHMWHALSLWHANSFEQAWSALDRALALGAPSWRIAWYKVMIIRDDKNLWNPQGFEIGAQLTTDVIKSRSDFEQANAVLKYFEASNPTNPGGCLTQDFVSINYSDTDGVLYATKESELADIMGKLEQRTIRPSLVIVNGSIREHGGASMRELMLHAGYIFWHSDFRFSMYRTGESMAAPNFWNFKTLLPTRQDPSPKMLEPKTVQAIKLKSAHKISENVERYLIQAKMAIDSGMLDQAHKLIREGLAQEPKNQLLTEAEKMIVAAIQAS